MGVTPSYFFARKVSKMSTPAIATERVCPSFSRSVGHVNDFRLDIKNSDFCLVSPFLTVAIASLVIFFDCSLGFVLILLSHTICRAQFDAPDFPVAAVGWGARDLRTAVCTLSLFRMTVP